MNASKDLDHHIGDLQSLKTGRLEPKKNMCFASDFTIPLTEREIEISESVLLYLTHAFTDSLLLCEAHTLQGKVSVHTQRLVQAYQHVCMMDW